MSITISTGPEFFAHEPKNSILSKQKANLVEAATPFPFRL